MVSYAPFKALHEQWPSGLTLCYFAVVVFKLKRGRSALSTRHDKGHCVLKQMNFFLLSHMLGTF